MIRKTLLLVLLAAFVAVATEALSQSPSAGQSPQASKSQPPAEKSPSVTSRATPTSKESSSSKTFPTSSQSFASSSSARREIVIERAVVTLIDDNKVPANEAGMLIDVSVEEGQSVEKNAVLAQIDNRSTLAKQRVAEAQWFAATAQAENNAEVDVAEKAVDVTKTEYDQSVEIRLRNPAAVSDSQLRKDKFNWEKSMAQVVQAKNEKHIAGLTANAKKAEYDAASIELDLRQPRAPFNGLVVEIMKRPGDWVTIGEPIMHIVRLDRLRVKGFVLVSGPNGASHDEVFGKPVTITVFSAGDKEHKVKGVIGFASPVIHGVGTLRQFPIWAEVDNEKLIDPVTGQESWKIQPGSKASMTIDLTPKPATSGKADKGKVQSFKPVAEAEKSGTKKGPRAF